MNAARHNYRFVLNFFVNSYSKLIYASHCYLAGKGIGTH